jgi:hemerythrin-like domain-containing protein
MEQYLNRGIKDIISEYPKVGEILEDYDIGCVPCSLGTCLLKDIVEIHNLDIDEEKKLMTKIAAVIYPGRQVEIPVTRRKRRKKDARAGYSPPLKKLVDEHVLIKRWVSLIPGILERFDPSAEEGRNLVQQGVDFIRNFADRYHHAKEEEILFKYFDGDLDIIKTMHRDHENAREHVRGIIGALEKGDRDSIVEHFESYKELLAEHIKKEDEILYPWMDRMLSIGDVGRLYSSFNEVDKQFGDAPNHYRRFIERLEMEYSSDKTMV